MADFLLAWDRVGFRILVFGGIAVLWILYGRLGGASWNDLIRAEMMGAMPWVLLAPLVIRMNHRIRVKSQGMGYFLGAHLLGVILVFLPYWILQRGFVLAWTYCASCFETATFALLIPTKQNLLGSLLAVPFFYLIILLGAEAMNHARALREEQALAERLVTRLAEARLALLQRQLHPHFLFNALQAISTLLHRDPAKADSLVLHLSALLRAMLEEASGQLLSLRSELALIRNYLDIEQARFEDRLHVEWNIDESLLDVSVPSLIILPLVDNAIRHGLSPKVGPGRLQVSVRSEEVTLVITVQDDGMGATLPLRSGVGIGNTQERLITMYGAQAGLEIETRPNEGFLARIHLPLEREQA